MRRTQSTLVRDIAQREVRTVSPETTLAECARLMREHHVGSLVVVDGGAQGKPVGIVTDRDIVLEAVALALDPQTLCASDIAPQTLGTVGENDDLLDALARMRELGVRRLPVTGADGRLAGIVALDDLLAMLAQQFTAIVDACAAERTREAETRR